MKFNFEIARTVINNNITDVSDLVTLLEITIEDVIEAFPDKLRENWYKFGGEPTSTDDEFYEEEDDEENRF